MTAAYRPIFAAFLIAANALAADPETPASEAVQPASDAVKPASDAVKPASDAVKPTSDAVKPASDAVKPATDAVKPASDAGAESVALKPTRGEKLAFYAAGGIYGLTAGIWIDSLFGLTDPGVAPIFPVVLGAGGAVGAYLLDQGLSPRRGVLAAATLGMGLGAANGVGIAATQAQYSQDGKGWNFATQGTFGFVLMTAGAAGGYAYGEYVHPDAKTVAFVGNGAAWGAITGSLFGAGVTGGEWPAGAGLWGTIGLNAGTVVTAMVAASNGAPTFRTQRYMWYGYGAGTAISSLIYVAYAFSDGNPRRGLVTNALGGVAGLVGGALWGAGLEDAPDEASNETTSHFAFSPVPGGAMAMASGAF